LLHPGDQLGSNGGDNRSVQDEWPAEVVKSFEWQVWMRSCVLGVVEETDPALCVEEAFGGQVFCEHQVVLIELHMPVLNALARLLRNGSAVDQILDGNQDLFEAGHSDGVLGR